MAHELKTPLNAILGFSELLKSQFADDPDRSKVFDYAGYIHESGELVLRTINEILDHAKSNADHHGLVEKASNLGDILRLAIAQIQTRANSENIRIVLKFSTAVPSLMVDPQKICRIVINLLSNAVKFTPAGGTITIEAKARRSDGAINVVVSDTGMGISPADLPRIMEPYQQAVRDVPGKNEGTGLGIPIAAQLAQLHGGTVKYKSEPGRGTRATLTLPKSRVLRDTVTYQDARCYGLDAASIAARGCGLASADCKGSGLSFQPPPRQQKFRRRADERN